MTLHAHFLFPKSTITLHTHFLFPRSARSTGTLVTFRCTWPRLVKFEEAGELVSPIPLVFPPTSVGHNLTSQWGGELGHERVTLGDWMGVRV